MTGRLKTKYAPAFSRDLKKAAKRNWSLTDLEAVIGLVLDTASLIIRYEVPSRDAQPYREGERLRR